MPPTAGSSTAEQPRFYYDFASPESYLVAERALHALGEVPEWIPVGVGSFGFRCAEEVASYQEDVERRASELGLMQVRWPSPFPAEDQSWALLAATYAKWIGRGVAFSLAALRQAFAAGRDLSVPDNVLIAAAACEMHPAAVLKAVELRSVRDELARATAAAAARGVRDVPAIAVGAEVFHGDAGLPAAARAAAAAAA